MPQKKKTILITGGAGFIGSHLCKKYLDEGHRVICVDNLLTTVVPKNIDTFLKTKNFRFIKHDIVFPLTLNEKVDWIFNLACPGSYTIYQYDPIQTIKTNTLGMINILELARRDNALLLQASTSEIYGDPLEIPQHEEYKGNVNPLGPRACYDEGKRVAETLCMDYFREYGVKIKIVRIFNTYGPNMDRNDGRAVTNFIVNALDGKDIIVYGDGTHTRSFQYIDDLVRGIDLMMKKENFIGPVNLGNPGEITMIELAQVVLRETGSESRVTFTNKASDDPKRRCPDIVLAENKLGWSPKVSLHEGLTKTIEYFRATPPPDKKILVFSTTYYPEMGFSEKALWELSEKMPDTEFHIITTKIRKGRRKIEKINNNCIHRVGFGFSFDKFLLPLFGLYVALRLQKTHQFRFVWSIMASYGGLAMVGFRFFNPHVSYLLTLGDQNVEKRTWRSKFFAPIIYIILKNSDSVYITHTSDEAHPAYFRNLPRQNMLTADGKIFVDQVRYTYTDLLNQQERKLGRPK